MAKVIITSTAVWEVPDAEVKTFVSEFQQFSGDHSAVEDLIHEQRKKMHSTGIKAKIVGVSGSVITQ